MKVLIQVWTFLEQNKNKKIPRIRGKEGGFVMSFLIPIQYFLSCEYII